MMMSLQYYGQSSSVNGTSPARPVRRVHRSRLSKAQLAVIVAAVADGLIRGQGELAAALQISLSLVQRAKCLPLSARQDVLNGTASLGPHAKPAKPAKPAIKIIESDDRTLRDIIARRGVDHVV